MLSQISLHSAVSIWNKLWKSWTTGERVTIFDFEVHYPHPHTDSETPSPLREIILSIDSKRRIEAFSDIISEFEDMNRCNIEIILMSGNSISYRELSEYGFEKYIFVRVTGTIKLEPFDDFTRPLSDFENSDDDNSDIDNQIWEELL